MHANVSVTLNRTRVCGPPLSTAVGGCQNISVGESQGTCTFFHLTLLPFIHSFILYMYATLFLAAAHSWFSFFTVLCFSVVRKSIRIDRYSQSLMCMLLWNYLGSTLWKKFTSTKKSTSNQYLGGGGVPFISIPVHHHHHHQ
jgi:hypothetical protein